MKTRDEMNATAFKDSTVQGPERQSLKVLSKRKYPQADMEKVLAVFGQGWLPLDCGTAR